MLFFNIFNTVHALLAVADFEDEYLQLNENTNKKNDNLTKSRNGKKMVLLVLVFRFYISIVIIPNISAIAIPKKNRLLIIVKITFPKLKFFSLSITKFSGFFGL